MPRKRKRSSQNESGPSKLKANTTSSVRTTFSKCSRADTCRVDTLDRHIEWCSERFGQTAANNEMVRPAVIKSTDVFVPKYDEVLETTRKQSKKKETDYRDVFNDRQLNLLFSFVKIGQVDKIRGQFPEFNA